MATVDLFAIGNALIDQEFKVSDDFLTQQNLQKGTMQLTDGETQAALYSSLQASQVYKGQASGGSAANTTVAFSAYKNAPAKASPAPLASTAVTLRPGTINVCSLL